MILRNLHDSELTMLYSMRLLADKKSLTMTITTEVYANK